MARQAATQPVLYPSGAPLSDALVRGEVSIAPLLYNIISSRSATARRSRLSFRRKASGGALRQGRHRRPRNPNAGRLFLNWELSDEGQTFLIKEHGNLTALKNPAANPPGVRPEDHQGVGPDFEQFSDAAT